MAKQVRTGAVSQVLSRAVADGVDRRVDAVHRAPFAVGVALIAMAASTGRAAVDIQQSTPIVDAPWPPSAVLPRIDTIDIVPGETADAPGSWTNTVPENFFVTGQTFKVNSNFRLGKVDIVGTLGATFSGSLHLYDLGDLGAAPVPANYNLATANGGNATADLFGGGAGLTITSANGTPRSVLEFLFSGGDQVNLQANHTYVLETWRAQNQGGTNTMYWERLGGASAIPPNPAPATGNPYALGDGYNATTGTANTIVRNQINGIGRDLMMAVFDTSALPAMQVDFNGGANTLDLHPTQDDPNRPPAHGPVWRGWGNLPTSGNNGSGPENGYGTVDAVTRTFAVSGIANSPLGALRTSIRAADIGDGGGGAPAYLADNPLINAHDWALPGRELDNSGNFTPTKDYTYRDFVMTEPGTTVAGNNNGTNHRMEVKLEGLEPRTTYEVKLYSYDNANRLGVSVFTDVTDQPLVFLPTGNSTTGAFTPGDGAAGTQYAPDGQYIDGYNGGVVPTFPATDDFRAISLYATTDANGNLVFAQTTITGLAGDTQTLPVLNGFEIVKDERGWAGSGADTNWNSAGNWANNTPANGKGQAATFGTSANTTASVDQNTTVGRLVFNGSSSYAIGGAGTLTLDDTSLNYALAGSLSPAGGNGRARIELSSSTAQQQTINAPMLLKKDTTVDTATANQTLTLTQLQPSAVIVNKTGAGVLRVNNVRAKGLRVLGGRLTVLPNSTAAGVSRVGPIAVANGATIDLTDNKLITTSAAGTFTAGAYTGVAGLVDTARGNAGNAQWDGTTGITTSDTRAINNGDLLSIGVATAAEARNIDTTVTTTFAGQNVLDSETLVMVTWGGDANLDGKINIDDYGQIDSNVSKSGTVFGWNKGDFNYDGKINIDDYGIIDGNIGRQTGTIPTAGGAALDGVAAVPEPASMALLAFGAAGLLRRRRRVQ